MMNGQKRIRSEADVNITTKIMLLLFVSTTLERAAVSQGAIPPSKETAVIHGTVKDPSGAVVSGANVQITKGSTEGLSGNITETSHQMKTVTDIRGNFSVHLPAGSYQLCVTALEGFTVACRTIEAGEGQDVNAEFALTFDPVWLKANGRAKSEVMDQRLRVLAGVDAIDCGNVQVTESPANATNCAIHSFRHGKPFVVRYDIAAIESGVAGGLASNGYGDVYGVLFDSMGMSSGDLKDGETMPDGSHTDVMPCPKPTRIRVNKRGRATCFEKKSRNPLWILDEE
jgi:hypothetical protein